MSAKPKTRLASRAKPAANRSAAPATQTRHGALRWLKDMLARSIGLGQPRKPLHVALDETGRATVANKSLSLLMQQRADLGARLLVHDPATQAVRHLFVVHDELRDGGWLGVEALPLKVIDRALTEAEILASDEPSPVLTTIIDSLRQLKVAADARAAHQALEREWDQRQSPEVSDTNFDEFELMERSWMGTVPTGLERPGRDV